MHRGTNIVLLIAFVGFFLFVAVAAALIQLGLEGRKRYRRGWIGFDPVRLASVIAVVLVLLAITMAR